ncbi:MAG: hypothetical protein PHX80_05595 [Candidatus Nanoarchaeia archaeon]|nr:hypothetical protein [Candidatus Nanoarchaeia archaeon]
MNRSELIYNRLMQCIHKGEIENTELIKMVKNISDILGLKTLTTYAKSKNISYQAAIKHKLEFLTIDTEKFVIDND